MVVMTLGAPEGDHVRMELGDEMIDLQVITTSQGPGAKIYLNDEGVGWFVRVLREWLRRRDAR